MKILSIVILNTTREYDRNNICRDSSVEFSRMTKIFRPEVHTLSRSSTKKKKKPRNNQEKNLDYRLKIINSINLKEVKVGGGER